MTGSFDSFERFQQEQEKRRAEADEASSPDKGAQAIDDMLDVIDRLFRDAELRAPGISLGTEVEEPTVSPDPVCASLIAVLGQLEQTDALAGAHPLATLIRQYLIAIRARTAELLAALQGETAPVAGAIEIELGFDDLHEFMMHPNIESWSAPPGHLSVA